MKRPTSPGAPWAASYSATASWKQVLMPLLPAPASSLRQRRLCAGPLILRSSPGAAAGAALLPGPVSTSRGRFTCLLRGSRGAGPAPCPSRCPAREPLRLRGHVPLDWPGGRGPRATSTRDGSRRSAWGARSSPPSRLGPASPPCPTAAPRRALGSLGPRRLSAPAPRPPSAEGAEAAWRGLGRGPPGSGALRPSRPRASLPESGPSLPQGRGLQELLPPGLGRAPGRPPRGAAACRRAADATGPPSSRGPRRARQQPPRLG